MVKGLTDHVLTRIRGSLTLVSKTSEKMNTKSSPPIKTFQTNTHHFRQKQSGLRSDGFHHFSPLLFGSLFSLFLGPLFFFLLLLLGVHENLEVIRIELIDDPFESVLGPPIPLRILAF